MLETRFYETPIELETRTDKPPTVRGLASPVYDGTPGSEYSLGYNVFERFAPGAFDHWLASKPDIPLFLNHDTAQPLDWASVWTSNRGLEYSASLDDTTRGKDAAILLSRKRIRGSSIGFVAEKVDWARDGEKDIRLVKQAKLAEISLVYTPAYKNAEAALREHQLWIEHQATEDIEKKLAEMLHSINPPK